MNVNDGDNKNIGELLIMVVMEVYGGGGGGGTANTSSSDSVFEADAAVLDEEPDNGIRGPVVQQKGRLNKSFMSWQTKIVLDPCFFQTIMNRP